MDGRLEHVKTTFCYSKTEPKAQSQLIRFIADLLYNKFKTIQNKSTSAQQIESCTLCRGYM